jgi:hypothetical protein
MQPLDPAEPPWTIRLTAGGLGSYSETGTTEGSTQAIQVSQHTLERLSSGGAAAAGGRCETHQKRIAKTGEKTIRYFLLNASSGCTFNYSEDDGLMDAVSAFQALATTMQHGEQMQRDLRFDRLGLDEEMQSLVADVQAGRALEVGNLAPLLNKLAQDDRVIARVRRDAARLLQDAGLPASNEVGER